MNHDNDAGGLDGIVALHKLVPAAEELDLLAELRADQDHESQELIFAERPHPDWAEPPEPPDPGADPPTADHPHAEECVDPDPMRLTHAQALGLVAHVLGAEPVPQARSPSTSDAAAGRSPGSFENSDEAPGTPGPQDAAEQEAPRPLSPNYWALRKILDDAGVELVPSDRDLALSYDGESEGEHRDEQDGED